MIATKVEGSKIHSKYLELGGFGIITGKESPEVLANEARVNAKLIAWVKEEELKLNNNMEHLKAAQKKLGEDTYVKVEGNKIIFWIQDGPIKEHKVNGIQAVDMLKYVQYLFESLNNAYPCQENALTITKIKEAIYWQDARTADRIKRDVEGKSKA